MTEKHFEQINRLYLYFMATHPDCDEGIYFSGDTNCILAFAEYTENIDFEEIRKILPELRKSQLPRLKKYISIVVEDYLLRHAKVLAIC